MKRLVAGLLAAAVLSGCAGDGETDSPRTPPERFELTGRLRYKGLEAQVTFFRDGRDVMEYKSPAGLRGLRVSLDQSFADMTFGELERRFTRGSLPAGAVPELLAAALDAAGESGVAEDGSCQGPAGTFVLALEEGTGNILKLSIPEEDLDLEVQSFKNLGRN